MNIRSNDTGDQSDSNSEKLYVRAATGADVIEIDVLIARVWDDPTSDLKCLAGESRFTAKELPAYIGNQDNATIVCTTTEQAIVGVLFLSRVAPTVFDLGISASPPGLGAGTKLIDAAIQESTAGGITEIYLDVFERNPAVRLYERKGFVAFEKRLVTNQRGEELPLLRMRIALPKHLSEKNVKQPGWKDLSKANASQSPPVGRLRLLEKIGKILLSKFRHH